MQSAIFAKTKVPIVITKSFLIVSLVLAFLVAGIGFSPKASAATSFMLVDAPGCGTTCPYGPEYILRRFSKVRMVCYKDMTWRTTNGQRSNRWLRVIPDNNPTVLLYTPAPAVGNQVRVNACR